MTEGQLASRTNDPLVAGGKGQTTVADFGTIILAIVPTSVVSGPWAWVGEFIQWPLYVHVGQILRLGWHTGLPAISDTIVTRGKVSL